MNVVRSGGVEIAANADLLKCVELAMDLSAARRGEIEVLTNGVKMHGFTNGRRTYPARIGSRKKSAVPPTSAPTPPQDKTDRLPVLNLAALEAMAIEDALTLCGGSVERAAEVVGVSRTTMWRKIQDRKYIEARRERSKMVETFGNVLNMRRAA